MRGTTTTTMTQADHNKFAKLNAPLWISHYTTTQALYHLLIEDSETCNTGLFFWGWKFKTFHRQALSQSQDSAPLKTLHLSQSQRSHNVNFYCDFHLKANPPMMHHTYQLQLHCCGANIPTVVGCVFPKMSRQSARPGWSKCYAFLLHGSNCKANMATIYLGKYIIDITWVCCPITKWDWDAW